MTQFTSQAAFLLVVTALSIGLDLGDVVAAQMSQGINVVWSGLCFFFSWRLFEHVPARHVLPEGHSLLTQGFSRVYQTAKDINQFYKHGTRWFFLAIIFAEASANAFTVVAVVFLDEQLGLSFTDIGIFFFVSLVSSIPGAMLGSFVTRRSDPKRSWQLSMMFLFTWAAGGAIILDYLPRDLSYLAYVWGGGIGMFLGWFYPVENLFFCMCLPKGQEAELSGFFVYCTQILGWLPPLIFSVMVEAKVSQTYGVVAVSAFLLIAVALVSCSAPWEDILRESGRVKEINLMEEDASAASGEEIDIEEAVSGKKVVIGLERIEEPKHQSPEEGIEIIDGTGRGSASSGKTVDA
jgi:MFS-type transporter involved in bile tolerance (Atg22 family)